MEQINLLNFCVRYLLLNNLRLGESFMDFKIYQEKASLFGLTDMFNQEKLMNILDWLNEEGISIYQDECLKLFGRKQLNKRDDNQLIEQAIPKNINDLKKKYTDINYYISNVTIFSELCQWIAETTLEYLKNFEANEKDVLIYNYSHLISYILSDSLFLLTNCKIYIDKEKDNSQLYGEGKNPLQHAMGYWQFIRQIIFGQQSFHSFIDRELDMSIGMIRMAVEVRLRRGFGILGKIKKEDSSVHPLPVESLLECMKQFQNDINMPIPVHLLIRIYGWSNIFVHGGIKDYTWLPIKIWLYLKDFLIGFKTNGSNVNNGIRLNENTLKDIQNCIKSKINQDIYELWTIDNVDAIIE